MKHIPRDGAALYNHLSSLLDKEASAMDVLCVLAALGIGAPADDKPVMYEKHADIAYRTDKAAFVDERDVVRNVFKRGHMIASHSYCHHHMAAYTPELVRADTRACEDHLEELIGVRPRIYRPPFIEYSPTSMSILQAELGYTVVSANIYAEDTRYYSSLARTLENYRNAYWRRRTSYISLMHDSICSNHAALPTIIKTFSCAGYEFVSLDTCLGLESPYRDGKTNPAKRGRHDPQATCAALADISSLDELPDAPARSENASR